MSIITELTGNRRADRTVLRRVGWLTLLFWGLYQSGYGQTVIPVTSTNDNGLGTLRQALADIDGSSTPGTFTITFAVSGVITLTGPLTAPADKDVTLTGPSATTTAVTLSGGGSSGILNIPVSATLTARYLAFANGSVNGSGGAISLGGGILRLAYCYLHHNTATSFGGAVYQGGGSFTITNSTFAGNTAISNSGALHKGSSDPGLIDNCTFSGNVARAGGAIEASPGSLTISNSTFTGNQAIGVDGIGADGGAIYGGNSAAPVTINNCLITGNTSSGGGPDLISGFNSATGYNLTGNTTGASLYEVTTGNLTDIPAAVVLNPVLAANDGPTPTHALISTGPAINAGPPASTDADQRGLAVFDNRRDIGAFESQVTPLVTAIGSVSAACNGSGGFSLTVTGGSGSGYAYRLTDTGTFTTLTGASPYTVAVRTAGSYTVTVQDGQGNLSTPIPLMLTGPPSVNSTATPSLFILPGQSATLTASGAGSYQWSTGENTAAISVSVADTYSVTGTTGSCTAVAAVTLTVPTCGTVVYVTQTGAGSRDGSSWSNAFSGTSLQTAIQVAAACGARVWVAQGLYKPTIYTGPDSRTVSFAMAAGVAIYGGFTGSETALSGRPVQNPMVGQFSSTTLSGDIGIAGNQTDNSFHVLSSPDGLTTTDLLDGFVITSGNANGEFFNSGGGGMFIGNSSPTVQNCLFVQNTAVTGGAVYTPYTKNKPVLMNCAFLHNSAGIGGAIALPSSGTGKMIVSGCRFESNSAVTQGGAISTNASIDLTDCLFQYNMAGNAGGAIDAYRQGESFTVNRCAFRYNTAGINGGAIDFINSNDVLTNCVFQSNTAGRGGGITFSAGTPKLVNCLFRQNSAVAGGAFHCSSDSRPTLINCSVYSNSATTGGAVFLEYGSTTLVNTILFGNGGSNTLYSTNSEVFTNTLRYSLIEPEALTAPGVINGPGNITTGTSPFVSDSDLQLAPGSIAVNAGDVASQTVTGGPYSATALPATDLAGAARIAGGRVDIGAYESQTDVQPLPCGLTPVATGFRASGEPGPGNCSVQLLATATGDRFVMTGPSGYVFSAVYRNAGTYAVTGLNVRQPGVYTLTVYSGSCSVTYTTEVYGKGCR